MSLRQNPFDVYKQILIPLLEENGFELIGRLEDNSDENRLISRHRFVRQTPIRPQFWERNVWPEVDVIGIPMGQNFLVIHANVCQSSEDTVKCYVKTKEPTDRIRGKLMDALVVKLIELLSVSINDLPLELKFRILSFLSIQSLFQMTLVSSFWRTITLDDQLWRLMVKQDFPAFYHKGIEGQNWKSVYKDAFRNRKLLERRKSWATRGLPSSLIFPALPPSPPLLPILGPPVMPMLPPPPPFFRDLVPEEVRNAFPHIPRHNSIARPLMFGNPHDFDIGF